MPHDLQELEKLLAYPLLHYKQLRITPGGILEIIALYLLFQGALKLITRIFRNKLDLQRNPKEIGHYYTLRQITRYLLNFLFVIFALELSGVNLTVMVAGSTALFVGVGLGLQSIFLDFFSGLIILFEKPIKVNDVVEVDHLIGRVLKIGVRATEIVTRDAIVVIVPNSKFLSGNVINWDHDHPLCRYKVSVGAAYDSDIELVKSVLFACATAHPDVQTNPPPYVALANFGDSGLEFNLYFWSYESFEIETIASEVRYNILEAFRQNDIQIPFPQREIRVIDKSQ